MRDSRGQVGLILIVIMGVLIALSLSVAGNALSDITLSRRDREDAAVFSVAEQGIEEALNIIRTTLAPDEPTGENFAVSTDFAEGEFDIVSYSGLDIYIPELGVAEVDVVGYNPSPRNLWVYWTLVGGPGVDVDEEGAEGCTIGSGCSPAALEVIQMRSDGSVSHAFYNPYDYGGNPVGDNFDSAVNGQDVSTGEKYLSKVTIELEGNTLAVRLKPLGNGATIGVYSTWSGVDLPVQLYEIPSFAAGGDVRSDIQGKRTNLRPDSIFDFAVFADDTIVK